MHPRVHNELKQYMHFSWACPLRTYLDLNFLIELEHLAITKLKAHFLRFCRP